MKVLAMSRDIWVPRVYRFRNYLGQGCMSWISWLDMNSSVILRQWAALTLGGQSLRLVDRNVLVPECRIPLNNVSCFLCNHYCGSIQVATDHAGHDGSINDSEVFHPEDPGLQVDHSSGVRGLAHLTGAAGVVSTVCFRPYKGIYLFV